MADLSILAERLDGWTIDDNPTHAWEQEHPAGFGTVAPASAGLSVIFVSPPLLDRFTGGEHAVMEAIAEWLDYSATRIAAIRTPVDLVAGMFAQDRSFEHRLLVAAGQRVGLDPEQVFTTDYPRDWFPE